MLYETLDIIKWKEPKEDVSFGDVIDDVVRTVGGGGRNMVASSARWRGQRSGVPLHLLAISISERQRSNSSRCTKTISLSYLKEQK